MRDPLAADESAAREAPGSSSRCSRRYAALMLPVPRPGAAEPSPDPRARKPAKSPEVPALPVAACGP
jgi:hypothetical protein